MSIRAGVRSGGIRRVVVWGTCDTSKPRVRILLQGLRDNGIEVIECRREVWQGIQDKSQVKGAWRWLGLLASMFLAYPVLLLRYLRLARHDCVLVCYPAFVDVAIIRPFAWMRSTPVVMDWFLSAYDTVVLDRKLLAPRSIAARLLHGLEWLSVRAADRLFMDTHAHAARMETLFGLAGKSCGAVWVGVETDHFESSRTHPSASSPAEARVLFYGQFIPLHGIDTIVRAAALLRDQPIHWLIVGSGQQQEAVDALIAGLDLPHVQRIAWVDYDQLPRLIEDADICLGIFGESEKAASVVPNKVFQILACARPLITRDSPAIRELVKSGDPAVQLIGANDPRALADAVLAWTRHPPAAGANYRDKISPSAIGAQFRAFLDAPPA